MSLCMSYVNGRTLYSYMQKYWTTDTKEENLPQAKFLIDTLAMLKEKTKANLTQQESELLENVLYELRMQYISIMQGKEQGGKTA